MSEAAVLKRLRKVCLSLPETSETVKWGHPTFVAGQKMFAVLDEYRGRPCIAFRTDPCDKRNSFAIRASMRRHMRPPMGGSACTQIAG
jgi:predicted DNA-binding protein (MmcQ/YjbR family)